MRAASINDLLRRAARLLCATCLIVAWSSRAEAAPHCSISTTSVSFGSYDVFSITPTDSTGTVSYRCTGSAATVQITLDFGSNAQSTTRYMTNGPDLMTYGLYLDAAMTSIWGDGTGSTLTYQASSPPNNQWVNVTVYGRVPAGQDVSAGPYADTVTATINF